MNDLTTQSMGNIKSFLDLIVRELDVKNSSVGIDKDGFFIWIKNSNAQCKRIILGEEDMLKNYDDIIKEIKELIDSQKW